MLAPADPLLGDGRDNAAIDDQCSGRIVTLGDTVLPLIETWPMRALKGHRAFESTDAKNLHAVSGQGRRDAVHAALLSYEIQLTL